MSKGVQKKTPLQIQMDMGTCISMLSFGTGGDFRESDFSWYHGMVDTEEGKFQKPNSKYSVCEISLSISKLEWYGVLPAVVSKVNWNAQIINVVSDIITILRKGAVMLQVSICIYCQLSSLLIKISVIIIFFFK